MEATLEKNENEAMKKRVHQVHARASFGWAFFFSDPEADVKTLARNKSVRLDVLSSSIWLYHTCHHLS